MQTFTAKIYKAGINPCVDVPERVSASFHKSGYIPVKGEINETARFRTNLVPIGNGRYRLFVNGEMRQNADVGPGDRIIIKLAFDAEPQTLPIPKAWSQALAKNAKAQAAWDGMAPSHQKEWLAYFNHLKTAAAIERNVKKAIAKLSRQK